MHGVKITKGILSFQETLLKNIPTKEEGKKKKKKGKENDRRWGESNTSFWSAGALLFTRQHDVLQ